MAKLIQSKKFYKSALILMLPIILQQLVSNAVVFIDNFMVGQVSEAALAGVFSANQAYFILSTSLFGLGAGAGIFLAQFRGAKNSDGVSYAFRWTLKWSLMVATLFVIGFKVFEDQFLSLFTKDAATIKEAKAYFGIVYYAYILSAITIAYGVGLRTLGKAKWTFYNEALGLVFNVVFNYAFIFGKLGAPELGVQGAAISTLLSRVLQIVIYVYMGNRADADLNIFRVFKVKKAAGLTKDIIKKAIPMVVNETLWSFSLVLAVAIVATRGQNVLTAYSVRQSIAMFSYIIFGSMGGTVAIMVGQKLGADKHDEALNSYKGLIGLGFAIAWIVVIINWIIAPMAVDSFNVTGETRKLAIDFLRYGALLFPLFILNATSFFVIRAGGRMKMAFALDSCWNWIIFIPALYFCMNSDLPVIWAFMLGWSTDFLKSLFVVPYAWSGKWTQNLVAKYNK